MNGLDSNPFQQSDHPFNKRGFATVSSEFKVVIIDDKPLAAELKENNHVEWIKGKTQQIKQLQRGIWLPQMNCTFN